MHFLIRKQTGRGAGEALETEYQGESLVLGNVSASMVPLPGVEGLLTIEPSGDDKWRATGSKLTFEHNAEIVRKADLKHGDVLIVEGNVLEVISTPAGFDFALELQLSSAGVVPGSGQIELAQTAWSTRKISWALGFLVLVAFLLIPLAGVLRPELADLLRASPLPDDGLWSSGPLASAHQTSGIATDCQACHQQPFVMVRDSACLDCHRETQEHVDVAVFDSQPFSGERCASCHREHNEPAQVVRRDIGLCLRRLRNHNRPSASAISSSASSHQPGAGGHHRLASGR